MPSILQEYKFETFQGGYNTDLDAELLPKHFITGPSQNVQFNFGILSKRDGHIQFGPLAPFTGVVNGLYVFQRSNGTNYLLAKTTTNLYQLTGSTWTDISATGTITASSAFAPQFVSFNDKVYFTDGSNPIMFWDGIALNASKITGNGAPDNCYSIAPFASYLFAIAPTITGTFFGFRVMWSDFLNPLVWNAGQAGQADLIDTPELVQNAEVFGRWMAIYKQRSIYNTTFIGAPIFFDFRRIDTPGLLSRRTLVRIPNLGLFALGSDDVYINDLTQARPIGKPLRQEVLTNLNYAALDANFAWVRPDRGRVYLHICTGTNTFPDTVHAYSYVDGQWMPDGPWSARAGYYSVFSNNIIVGSLIQTIASYTSPISTFLQANQRQSIFTDGTNVFYLLDGSLNDQPTSSTLSAISSKYSSGKVALVQKQDGEVVPCSVQFIKVVGNNVPGTVTLTVDTSIGDGVYTTYGPYTVMFTQAMIQMIPCEIYGERFQVHVSNGNASEGFQHKQISLMFRPRGRV